MDVKDIDALPDGPRRRQALQIWEDTHKANSIDGDGPWAGGTYDMEAWRARDNRARELALAAVDRFLNGGQEPEPTTVAYKSAPLSPEVLAAVDVGAHPRASASAPPAPAGDANAFSWDEVLAETNSGRGHQPATNGRAQGSDDEFGWGEILAETSRTRSSRVQEGAKPSGESLDWHEGFDEINPRKTRQS